MTENLKSYKVMELSDQHKFSFNLFNCINTEETDNGYEFTWSMRG